MKKILLAIFLFILLFLSIPYFIVCVFPKSVPADTSSPYQPPEVITIYQTKTNNVIELSLEDCVKKVLTQEALQDAPMEYWKAQAIATRSYILNQIGATPHQNAMLCDDANHCLNLYLSASPSKTATEASEATKGNYLAFYDLPAKACYFHVSSGKTESAQDVWKADIPYLISVPSESDLRAAKYQSRVFYPMQAFKTTLFGYKKIDSKRPAIGKVERSDVGHVKEMILYGTSFTGHELQTLFHLNSTNFTLSIKENYAVFDVLGDGHCVGMSKFGAKTMAEDGYVHQDILAHYYPNTILITQK